MNRFVCLFVCLFVFNSTSYAARIQVEVSGILSNANSTTGATSEIIKVGDAFTYRFVFNETTNPDGSGDYLSAITSSSGSAGGFSFAGQSGYASTSPSNAPGFGNIFQTIHSTNTLSNFPGNRNDFTQISGGPESGLPLNYINLVSFTGVDAVENSGFTRDKLPTAIPPGFGQLYIQFAAPGANELFIAYGALYTITVSNLDNVSPVPVPAAVWLFGSGLLSLLGFSQRSAVTKKAKL